MARELIPRTKPKDIAREAALRAASERQIVSGEQVEHSEVVGKKHVAITDRRLVITSIGWGGETAESIPLASITSLATTLSEGKIIVLQLSVPGRSWGELVLSGHDLARIHTALIRCLPVQRSAA